MTRRTSPLKIRETVLKKYNYSCAICGSRIEEVPLELSHIIPLSQGGKHIEENLIPLCANCNRTASNFQREIDFVRFVAELLKKDERYTDVTQEVILGKEKRLMADIRAKRRTDTATEDLIIECKSSRGLPFSQIKEVIQQMERYGKVCKECKLVLAYAGRIPEQGVKLLAESEIEVWDIDYINQSFAHQITHAINSYYKFLFSCVGKQFGKPREIKLVDSLKNCRPGRSDWNVYQALIGNVIEALFTPPLEKPIAQSSDKPMANRRDFVIPNYSRDGFWAFIREKYKADYIVVDAKNYTRKVKKMMYYRWQITLNHMGLVCLV
jgi:hypothetical protein